MRLIFLPIAAYATIATAQDAPDSAKPAGEIPAEYRPCTGTGPVFNPEACEPYQDVRARLNCRDTIERVREANGQPALRRENAATESPPMIAAVDHRVDGCSVMVMHGDTSDIRPLPERSEGARVYPAR